MSDDRDLQYGLSDWEWDLSKLVFLDKLFGMWVLEQPSLKLRIREW